ncbi:phage tail assembly chaperone family protein, TAC [Klebsiella aerogenes]|uniref:phage tail assembly chaperone family protein, TAC n=1 Tax=Klebsiella aerogenes TaxID=548 RepID=UPI0022793563|nr:phage tail assembly chaperone family protein, TAC [Klebsiella aerogenes]MCY4762667.1 phage tail assembly chaperone family protein, TAC [Klebsiella aerogenes]HBT3063100.1 cytochrome [Klebsiella aerogenes]
MNIQDMLSALTPKRESIELKGFKFYARPMTVKEYGSYYSSTESEQDKDDQMILKCIEDENGKPVFSDIKEVQSLYTNVRFTLAALISKVSFSSLTAEESEKN